MNATDQGSLLPQPPLFSSAAGAMGAYRTLAAASPQALSRTGSFSPQGYFSKLRALFQTRPQPGFGLFEGLSLAIYSLLLAWCIPHHESWFDEAQAWLIARASTIPDLVLHRLHYEGAPALWHLLLWVEIRLGVSFFGMHVIAGCLAVMGVLVWLVYSPLPRIITLLMPFTFFLQYQYAVVARTYVLAPLFAYLLMALYQNRKSSPMLFCVVAGLFANCSLHMAAFAAGLALIYAHDRLRSGVLLSRVRLLAPAAVLLVFFAAAAAVAVPTADGSSTTANPVVGAIRKTVAPPDENVAQPAVNINEISPVTQTEPPQQGALGQAFWRAMNAKPDAGTQTGSHLRIDGRMLKHLLTFVTAATASISTSNLLAIGFLLLLAVNLSRAHLWITLLPWAFVQACNVLVAGEAHHFGLLWIALTCSLWVLSLEPLASQGADALRTGLYAYLLLLVGLQMGWSAHALRGDIQGPYSSSREVADYFATLPKDERIAAFDDDSVTVNAYLPKSPYFNQKLEYWPFSRTKDPSLFLEETMAQKPDMVSLKMASPDQPVMYQWVKLAAPHTVFVAQAQLNLLLADGYHETHRFCGQRFFRNASESTDCRLIFEPLVSSRR